MEFPRPYDVVVYLTSTNCRLCEEVLNDYKKSANFYKEEGSLYSQKDNNGN